MALKMDHVLGMNARNHRFTSLYNSSKAKKIADSKLLTKSTLRKAKLPTPRLYKVFRSDADLDTFNFLKLEDSFVIKPNKGLGGEGIIVIESRGETEGTWINTQGEVVTIADLKLHINDILEGRFSMNDLPDIAFVEERVRIHPIFEPFAYHGTPDIRIIVFNKIPVMAMLRLPTRESGGRANLFQGAVGAGIDLASGTTTYAIHHNQYISVMPGTRQTIRGLALPEWDKILELAVRCQEETNLGYLGADIVLQPSVKKPGKTLPKVLELNAQPGLKIQLANKAGLLRRLERVEGLEVDSPEKGIRIARALFGATELTHLSRGLKGIGVFETVQVVNQIGEREDVKAKVDTGAFRTSIDEKLAEDLGLLRPDNVLYERYYRSALGRNRRKIIDIEFYLQGRKIKTTANVIDRSHLKRPMLIGRRDLKSFVIEFN